MFLERTTRLSKLCELYRHASKCFDHDCVIYVQCQQMKEIILHSLFCIKLECQKCQDVKALSDSSKLFLESRTEINPDEDGLECEEEICLYQEKMKEKEKEKEKEEALELEESNPIVLPNRDSQKKVRDLEEPFRDLCYPAKKRKQYKCSKCHQDKVRGKHICSSALIPSGFLPLRIP